MLDINYISIGTAKLAYKVFGNQKIDLVIEMGLGSCIAEWWDIAEKLSDNHTVLLYERAGYGNSQPSSLPRIPQNIALELYHLLEQLEHEKQLTILAHSQGALYAQQFARLYPDMIKGMILADPLSANDNRFKVLLTPKEYKQGGIDKFSNLSIIKKMLKLHLAFIVKAMMKNAPPMYYYKFNAQAENYILNSLVNINSYNSAEDEYISAHDENIISSLKSAKDFPDIPLALITHSSELSEKEIMEFGRASKETAQKVENIWQMLMQEYLSFSKNSKLIRAEKSTHYIHLTQPELLKEAVAWTDSIK